MSLTSRIAFLAGIADKAKTKVEPLIAEFEKIKTIKSTAISQLQVEVDSINDKISLAEIQGNSKLVGDLEKHRSNLIEKVDSLISKSVNILKESIETAVEQVVKDIDGLSVSVSSTDETITPIITPNPLNLTTDFVKNTILDPSTVAVVATTVTGTAGPYPVTGTGVQAANITTT